VKIISVNQDMPGSESHRDACVLPTDFDKVGASQIELLGSLINYDGNFAILSATTDAPDQNYWIAGMKEALKDPKYAKMKLLEIVYGDDKPEKSRKEADGLLTKYADLRAILAPTSVGVEQAAKAVQSRGVYPGGANAASAGGGKGVVVTGLGIPNQMRGYLKEGVITKVARGTRRVKPTSPATSPRAWAAGRSPSGKVRSSPSPTPATSPCSRTTWSSRANRWCSRKTTSTNTTSRHACFLRRQVGKRARWPGGRGWAFNAFSWRNW
jgi:hypothetical protein